MDIYCKVNLPLIRVQPKNRFTQLGDKIFNRDKSYTTKSSFGCKLH